MADEIQDRLVVSSSCCVVGRCVAVEVPQVRIDPYLLYKILYGW